MSNRKSLFGLVLPALTIGIFAVFLAFSLMRLSAIDKNMRIEATQNMLWVISRAQVSSLQLQEAVTFRTLGLEKQEEVDRRLDIFMGHFRVLNDGPQRRTMARLDFAPILDRLAGEREKLAALTAGIGVGESAKRTELHEILEPYDRMLVRAANMAMVAEWEGLGSKLDNFRREIAHIILSLLVISIAGIGMTLHLARARRSASLRARLLERERAFSQLLVRSSSEAIVAVDPDRRCTMWNSAAAGLFGIAAEVATSNILDSNSDFFRLVGIDEAIDLALNGRPTTLTDQMFFRDLDAAPTYLDLRCFPLRDGAKIVGSILLISDVTEQHTARRALAERRDYLEEQVRERTHALNSALSRERAATDIYRNFAAMVSHQFRTPLAIVDSTLQRLMRRADRIEPSELIDRSSKARHAIARLVQLVERTLDAARLDAGQIQKRTEPRDLGKLIQEALHRQREETPESDFVFEHRAPVMAECDPVHTEHIITNLLSNAAKYAPAGSTIRILAEADRQGVRCTVVNHGRIAEQDRDKLFDRYFRGGNGHTKNGVGIGLYMARSLARLQDGDVTFEDAGAGQLGFTLHLPPAEAAWSPAPLEGAVQ
jgi:signal transduction histidine kinase